MNECLEFYFILIFQIWLCIYQGPIEVLIDTCKTRLKDITWGKSCPNLLLIAPKLYNRAIAVDLLSGNLRVPIELRNFDICYSVSSSIT
ncbi:hypothetical protein L1987_72770 [Smallanthus sonchifolius]|uniref:Uncharacterized protein n=1 Tax=Smallanthus sonchifolius TaxID=185202 RepID=A0ACB9AXG5_9ASTR|nr:hypothetical protein L1987_72770 [Smallanthus sonchifolius]